MKTVIGNMWVYDGRLGFIICVTTNGYIKTNGEGVMGAGCAKEAAERYPTLPRLLGMSLQRRGNVVSLLTPTILSFPVKHHWKEEADLKLIEESTKELKARAEKATHLKFILPRPGCGNGRLLWLEVEPIVKCLPDNVFVISK